jgi:putative ABC transport system permease protein
LLLGGVGAAALLYKSVVLFVILGLVLLIAGGLAGYYTVLSNGSALGKRFSSWQMIWRTIYAGRKQAVLSFATLAAGVFIVFAVGLNRRGFNDSSALLSGTGGYTLWCESSIPVYHNMQTKEGRDKLSLTDLPSDASVMQCLRHSADDASCLNLNKVTTPSVLGLNLDDIRNSDFVVAQNIFGTDGDAVFDRLSRKDGNVYPALVDETVLMWSLGKQLGDTLYYEADGGERIGLVLAATLSNSIFQGYVIIDRDLFADVWGETTGSEVFLLKTTDDETADVRTLLAQALNEYGVRVTTTNDRLKEFDSVTDTYLTIFMTLGGLGLLLGIMSFIIVIRKNLASRRGEISLYRMLGFTDERIFGVLYRENLLVPLFAIGIGVVSALVSIALGFMNVSVWIWLTAILLMLLLCLPVLVFVRRSVLNTIKATK